jgi:hypothetical protein
MKYVVHVDIPGRITIYSVVCSVLSGDGESYGAIRMYLIERPVLAVERTHGILLARGTAFSRTLTPATLLADVIGASPVPD